LLKFSERTLIDGTTHPFRPSQDTGFNNAACAMPAFDCLERIHYCLLRAEGHRLSPLRLIQRLPTCPQFARLTIAHLITKDGRRLTKPQVLDSVKAAGFASEVARLKGRFVIKDSDTSLRGAA
jgi:hypothetical protein